MEDNIYKDLILQMSEGGEDSGEDGPAKSQVQWKMFAIAYGVKKGKRKMPDWWGVRGPDASIPNFQNIVDDMSISEIKMKLQTPVPWTELPCATTEPNKGHKGHDSCSEEGFDDFVKKAPPEIKKDLDKFGSGKMSPEAEKAAEKIRQQQKAKYGDKQPDKPITTPAASEAEQKLRDYLKKKYGDTKIYPGDDETSTPSIGGKGKKRGTSKGRKSSKTMKKISQKLGWKGARFKRAVKNYQSALTKVGNLDNPKSSTAKQLKKIGFTKDHQNAALKGNWQDAGVEVGSTLYKNLNKLGKLPQKQRRLAWDKRSLEKPISKSRRESVEQVKEIVTEAMSSTERMRRYNKRHPEKVKNHLKRTQDDRVERNRAHREATKKHGEEYMKDKDVHHPDGVDGGKTMVVGQDHGRDKKENKTKKSTMNKNELLPVIKQILFNLFYNMEDVNASNK